VSELLAAYEAQVRDRVPDPLPTGVTVERDGPLLRFLGLAARGFAYDDSGSRAVACSSESRRPPTG